MPTYTYILHKRKIIQQTHSKKKFTCDLYSTHLCKLACLCVWVCIRRGVGEGGEGLLERWKLKIQNGRYFRSTELKQKVCPPFIMTCIAVPALWFALFRCRTKCTHAHFPYTTTLMTVTITLMWHGKNASFGTIKIKSEHGLSSTWMVFCTAYHSFICYPTEKNLRLCLILLHLNFSLKTRPFIGNHNQLDVFEFGLKKSKNNFTGFSWILVKADWNEKLILLLNTNTNGLNRNLCESLSLNVFRFKLNFSLIYFFKGNKNLLLLFLGSQ